MHTIIAICVLLAAEAGDLEARLTAAARAYDMAAAQALVEEARKEVARDPSASNRLLLGRALLLVAELARIDFEELSDDAGRSERRALANRIDAAAREGMQVADALGEISEAHRLRADFYGVMIRTKYQGKKYRNRMESNAARAMELDPKNANAYVSVARPFLFATPRQGGDLDKAFALLSKAVELDPDLEAARMLLAVAYEKRGEMEKADAEWEKILAANPKAIRSRKTLEIAGKVWSEIEDNDNPSEDDENDNGSGNL